MYTHLRVCLLTLDLTCLLGELGLTVHVLSFTAYIICVRLILYIASYYSLILS